MKLEDTARLALNSILHRQLRSWLTILGIVVGIAAIIALVSVSQGFQEMIFSQLSVFGSGTVIITPSHSSAAEVSPGSGSLNPTATIAGKLTTKDINSINSLQGISYIDGIVSGNAEVKFRNQVASAPVQGVDADIWKQIQDVPLQSGRYLTNGDSHSAVIGDTIANGLFNYDVGLNSFIEIEGERFKVVGIFKRAGSQLGVQDNTIIVPKERAKEIFSTPDDEISAITIKLSDSADSSQVVDNIEKVLLASHHVTKDEQDFTIISSDIIRESIQSITASFTVFLSGIAAISLFVGGIGIANTMFTSVMERTRQIGILKSLGATNSDIMKLFLSESAFLGVIGGVMGVILGVVISLIISSFSFTPGGGAFAGEKVNIPISITPELVIGSIAFSLVVGSLSGILPARRAASLDPVEALRYE